MSTPYDRTESQADAHEVERDGSVAQSTFFYMLAGRGRSDLPEPSSLGLDPVATAVRNWYDTRSRLANAADTLGITAPDGDIDRWLEIAGMYGSVAEQVMLAAAAEIETAYLETSIADGEVPSGMDTARRFFAEAACNSLLGAGQTINGMALRLVIMRPEVCMHSQYNGLVRNFDGEAFSEIPDAWPEAKAAYGTRLASVTASCLHPGVQELGAAVAELFSSPAWEAMRNQRVEDYHRWRRESARMAGINRRSPQRSAQVRRVPTEAQVYIDGDEIADLTVTLAHDGLRQVAASMERIRRAMFASLPALTFGRLSGDADAVRFTTRLIGSWHEPGCGCQDETAECAALQWLLENRQRMRSG